MHATALHRHCPSKNQQLTLKTSANVGSAGDHRKSRTGNILLDKIQRLSRKAGEQREGRAAVVPLPLRSCLVTAKFLRLYNEKAAGDAMAARLRMVSTKRSSPR
jgi:hypothetical protein